MKARFSVVDALITLFTLLVAGLYVFPIYWTVVTTLKPEYEVVAPGVHLIPETPTLAAYFYVFAHTIIGNWYVNSIVTASAGTFLIIVMAAGCAYAVSQLAFPEDGSSTASSLRASWCRSRR